MRVAGYVFWSSTKGCQCTENSRKKRAKGVDTKAGLGGP